MSNQCQVCSAPTDIYLCRSCVMTLRANLTALVRGPLVDGRRTYGLLDNLEDVVLKRTRLGGKGGHRKRGDEMAVPFEPHTGKMVKVKGEGGEAPQLSAQGSADLLMTQARNDLSMIIRDLCESRGIDIMRAFRTVPADFIGPLMPEWRRAVGDWRPTLVEMATWLLGNVGAIACDESAGQWFKEIDVLVHQIERAIDRPVKIELLGFCITQVDGNKTCDTALRAPEDAIEVRCRKCHTVRRCATVREQGQSDARRALIPWEKVLETNKMQPDGWRVNERTLRDWRATGVLKPRGWLRPNGSHGITQRTPDDVQLFKWNDVEQLRRNGVKRGDRKKAGVK